MSDPISYAIFGRLPISLFVPCLALFALLLISVESFRTTLNSAFWISVQVLSPGAHDLAVFWLAMSDVTGVADVAELLLNDFKFILETALPFHKDLLPPGGQQNLFLFGGHTIQTVVCVAITIAALFLVSEIIIRRSFRAALQQLGDTKKSTGPETKETQQEQATRKILATNLSSVKAWLGVFYWRWLYLVTDYFLVSVAFDLLVVRGCLFLMIVRSAYAEGLMEPVVSGQNVTAAILTRNDFLVEKYLSFIITDKPDWLQLRKTYGSMLVLLIVFAVTVWQRVFQFPEGRSLPRYLVSGSAAPAYSGLITGLRLQYAGAMVLFGLCLVADVSVLGHLGLWAVMALSSTVGGMVVSKELPV